MALDAAGIAEADDHYQDERAEAHHEGSTRATFNPGSDESANRNREQRNRQNATPPRRAARGRRGNGRGSHDLGMASLNSAYKSEVYSVETLLRSSSVLLRSFA